jgi:hypothetical protein
MTRQEREQVVLEFWRVNQGRYKAGEGAKAISDRTGIPVNSVRGLQHALYPPDARPWDLPAHTNAHVCPKCKVTTAFNDAERVRLFGPRTVWRGPANDRQQVKDYQSHCRKCRNAKRRPGKCSI